MYKVILTILYFTTLLVANCHHADLNQVDVVSDGNITCTVIDGYKVCMERDIIKRKAPNAQEYQHICVNGELVAAGYNKLKNRTTKRGIWQNNPYFSVNKDELHFYIDKNKYTYNFEKELYYKFTLPKNTIAFYNFNNYYTAYQYVDEEDKIALSLYSEEHKRFYKLLSDKNILLRSRLKHMVIDLIDDKDRDTIDSYLNNNRDNRRFGNSKKDRDAFMALLTNGYGSPTELEKNYLLIDSSKNSVFIKLKDFSSISEDKSKTKIVSLILSTSLEVISSKIFEIDSRELAQYLQSYDTTYSDLPFFVHGNRSIIILMITLFFFLISYKLIKYLSGGYALPSISSFFMLFYILLIVTGTTLLNLFYFQYEYNLYFYERKDILLNIWLYSVSGLIFIPLGMYIAKKVFHYDGKNSFTLFVTNKIDFNNEKLLFNILLLLVLSSLVVLLIYISKINTLPILGVFQHLDAENLAQLRSEVSNEFSGKIYRYVLFFKTLPLLYLLVAFISKDINKRWHRLFIFLLIYNIFVNIMDLQKAPVILMLLMLIVTYFYTKYKINWKYLIYFSITAFTILVGMYTLFMSISERDILTILSGPFHRAFIGGVSTLYWWQLYAEQHGYLNGITLPNPHHIFDFDHIQISKEVYGFVHPYMIDKGIIGSMPAVFWAEWFINFGVYALFFSMLLFGFVMQSLDILFINYMKKSKTVLILALYIYLIFYFQRFTVTTCSNIIIDPNFILPVILIVGLNYIVNRKGKIWIEKSHLNCIEQFSK